MKKDLTTRTPNNLRPSQLRVEYGIASPLEHKLERLTRGSKFGAANVGRRLSKAEIKAWERSQKREK